jgi:hypothetical protein
MSGDDAVDGSSAGTEVSSAWALRRSGTGKRSRRLGSTSPSRFFRFTASMVRGSPQRGRAACSHHARRSRCVHCEVGVGATRHASCYVAGLPGRGPHSVKCPVDELGQRVGSSLRPRGSRKLSPPFPPIKDCDGKKCNPILRPASDGDPRAAPSCDSLLDFPLPRLPPGIPCSTTLGKSTCNMLNSHVDKGLIGEPDRPYIGRFPVDTQQIREMG